MTEPKPQPEFPEPKDPKKRAEIAVEEAGGLPDDNPFTEVVENLRADGKSWDDIFWKMDEVFSVVDEGAAEEGTEMIAEWSVTAKVPDQGAPSGFRYETHKRVAETAEKAEQRVSESTGHKVVEEKTEQTDYGKYS
ncbi:hypothetical protein EXE48_11530 [Halorubrum sp. ASP1]|uniref:hypothetical protein n=1 Tax=Halorubrum sp. ASP1 TaxID=2518114 RepID=UPI0010F4E355|nr:hypothetical protein [Halorubrum sp. ASP1]TKX60596.1 hypothetical protein EXE48_11530 [Halorubrum sp. ASP1]